MASAHSIGTAEAGLEEARSNSTNVNRVCPVMNQAQTGNIVQRQKDDLIREQREKDRRRKEAQARKREKSEERVR